MAGSEDILIQVQAEMSDALKDFKNLEKQIKATKSTVDNQLAPATNTASNRVVSAGNKIKGAGDKIKNAIGTEAALAFGVAGTAALNFGKQCVQSAINAQQEWGRFTALVTQSGQSKEVADSLQASVKKVAGEMSRTVGDTREASLTFLQAGVSANQLETALYAAGGVAARAGVSQSEAASAINAALLGNGRQLKKLTGLRLEDYKTADGQIDKERLLNDLYNKNKGAIDQYANSTEGKMNKLEGAMAKFKTSIGEALLPVVSVLADIATRVAEFVANLPPGFKEFLAVLLVLGGAIGVVMGALGFLAPVLSTIGTIIVSIGEAGGIMAGLSAAFPGLAAGLGVIGGALSSILWPVLAVIAAFAALYLVGKQLGWWNDLSGMISKFGEVLGQVIGVLGEFVNWFVKLFTDFPAAQAQFNDFINFLGGALMDGLNAAWQAITGAVGGLIDALSTMFWDGINGAGSSITEAMNGLVDWINQGLSNAWNSLSSAAGELSSTLSTMIGDALGNIPQLIGDALTNLGNSVTDGGGLAAGIAAIFLPLPTLIFTILSRLGEVVAPALQSAWDAFTNWASGIVTGIVTWFSQIPTNIMNSLMNLGVLLQPILQQLWMTLTMMFNNIVNGIIFVFIMLPMRIWTIFMQVATFIWNALIFAWNQAVAGATQIFNGIVNALINLPGRIWTIISNMANRVRSGLQTAASNAKSKAKEIYDGVVNKVKEIPGKVAEEFGKIPGKITSALASAASAAASGAANIVSSFLNALHINSPGIIQRTTEAEFASLAPHIANGGVEAARASGKAGAGIVRAWSNSMTGLGIPEVDTSALTELNIPKLDILSNVDDMREVLSNSLDTELASTRINTGNPLAVGTTTNNYRTVNSDDHTTVYHIDNITLECGELTQAQSRQVLYNALDGLYPRGVKQ